MARSVFVVLIFFALCIAATCLQKYSPNSTTDNPWSIDVIAPQIQLTVSTPNGAPTLIPGASAPVPATMQMPLGGMLSPDMTTSSAPHIQMLRVHSTLDQPAPPTAADHAVATRAAVGVPGFEAAPVGGGFAEPITQYIDQGTPSEKLQRQYGVSAPTAEAMIKSAIANQNHTPQQVASQLAAQMADTAYLAAMKNAGSDPKLQAAARQGYIDNLIAVSKGNPGDHYVSGYMRENGTYVQPHYQTNPDSTKYDNYSSLGNYNPYTGKYGTRSPE